MGDRAVRGFPIRKLKLEDEFVREVLWQLSAIIVFIIDESRG